MWLLAHRKGEATWIRQHFHHLSRFRDSYQSVLFAICIFRHSGGTEDTYQQLQCLFHHIVSLIYTIFGLYRHLLVVFGGLQGLEASVDADENLDVTDPSVLFDLYLNTCPSQGSRTIRTEVGRLCWSIACQINYTHTLFDIWILFSTGGHISIHVWTETKNHSCLLRRDHGFVKKLMV